MARPRSDPTGPGDRGAESDATAPERPTPPAGSATSERPERPDLALLSALLGLARRPVGVDMAPDRGAFETLPMPLLKTALPYCVMVMQASLGKAKKALPEHFACPGSAHVFGFRETDPDTASGRRFFDFGLYADLDLARRTQTRMARLDTPPRGLAVAPLEAFPSPPKVVIVVAEAYQAMRLLQGHAYHHGVLERVRMVGNRGICSECTAAPFLDGGLNISLLCSNTRFAAKWRDGELALGMPYAIFVEMVRGVIQTADATEPDSRKRLIAERLGPLAEAPGGPVLTPRGCYFSRERPAR